jgi:hypothetical protein
MFFAKRYSTSAPLCKATYKSMATFDDEFVCSTERLLKPECSSIDLEVEQQILRTSPRKGRWARIWQYRLYFLVHLAIIAAYAIGFLLILEHVAKKYEHSPDLVNCELTYWPSKYCDILIPIAYSACSRCREV